MNVLPANELQMRCESHANIKFDPEFNRVRFTTREILGLRLTVPMKAPEAVVLAYRLLRVEEDNEFFGALLWFASWDMGTPLIESCGLRILEQMRRGYGATASVENAPGQLFRSDERIDAHAFLMLPLLFGWDAFFMPNGTRYFAYIRQNGSLFLVTEEAQVLEKLNIALRAYSPVPELPGYMRDAPITLS